jgi:hypothetical protein
VTWGTVMPLEIEQRTAFWADPMPSGELGDRFCLLFAIFMVSPYSAFASSTVESMLNGRAHASKNT